MDNKNIYTEVFPFAGSNDTLDKLDKYIKETIECECDHDGGGSGSNTDAPLIVNFTIQADQNSVSGFSSISDVVSTDIIRAFYSGRRVIGMCDVRSIFGVGDALVLTPVSITNEDLIDGNVDNIAFSTFTPLPTGGYGIIEVYASYAENETTGVSIISIS